jgi:hypothetical protein
MTKRREKFSNRALTLKLREIMAEVYDSKLEDEKWTMTSKGERLAEILVDRAIGWKEEVTVKTDVPGQVETTIVQHKPERWAIEMCYDRLEGKTPQALADETTALTAADKVEELSKSRINALTEEETKDGDAETA